MENFSQVLRQVKKQKLIWFGLVGMFLLAATITLIGSQQTTTLAILPRTFGQIVLCLLFVARWPL